MEFTELVRKSRSYRRFDGSERIPSSTLLELVELARFTPAASNLQRLRFVLSCDPGMNAQIYSTLGWAGSLPDWPGPEEHERPTAYVVLVLDKSSSGHGQWVEADAAIIAQTLLLAATERGLGGCMFGSAKKKRLAGVLQLADHLEVCLVVALGKPVERIVLEDAKPGEPVTYYRDPDGTHHVPKRTAKELVLQVYG